MKLGQLSVIAAAALVSGALFWPSGGFAGTLSIGECEGSAGCTPALILGFPFNPATTPDSASVTGFTTSDGTWDVTANATGSPPLSPPTQLDSSTITVSSTGPGEILLDITEQGNTTPLGVNTYASGMTVNSISGGLSITESTLNDPNNGLFSTVALNPADLLATNTFTTANATGIITLNTSLSDNNPFSVSHEYLITATAAGSVTTTITLASVPAPVIGQGLPAVLAIGGLFFGAKLLEHSKRRRSLEAAIPHAAA